MKSLLGKLKNPFQSTEKSCPECGSSIGKNARICPECGHNFLFAEAPRPFMKISYNMENCCSIFLIILIAVALLFLAVPFFKTIFFIIAAAVLIVVLIGLFLFARMFRGIWRIFGF